MTIGVGGQAGTDAYVAFFVETSIGSMDFASTTGGAFEVEPISVGFKTEIVSMKQDSISMTRGYTKRIRLDKTAGGTLEHYLHPIESPILLACAMGGTMVDLSISATVFSHTISPGSFLPTNGSLAAIVRKGTDFTHLYKAGRINSMKITGEVGEPIKCSYDFVFGYSAMTSSSTVAGSLSASTVMPFTYADGVFRYHNTVGSVGTSTVEEHITGFELTLNNNIAVDTGRSLGTNMVQALVPGKRDIEFKITQRFDTISAWSRFIANTMGVIQLHFEGSTITATHNYKMDITLPKVYHNSPDFELGSAGDILMQEIDFDVLVDDPLTTAGYDINMVVYNTVDSYTSQAV